MKSWSKNWGRSKRKSKQKKYIFNAPLHLRRKLMSATFSEELRKKYGRRNTKLRVGDKVKIMRGEFKSVVGKIKRMDAPRLKVEVDGAERKNTKGTKYNVPLDPSKLMILELTMDDKKRVEALRKK